MVIKLLRFLVAIAVLSIAATVGAAGQRAADPEVGPATQVALAYLERISAHDLDGLARFLTADAVFDDPTAVALRGAPLRYRGRDEIIEGFGASMTDTRNAGFELVSAFESSDLAVLTVVYRTEIRGSAIGAGADWVAVEVQGTTVIRVADGLVASHLDFVDYPRMLAQIEDARVGAPSPRPPASKPRGS